MKSIQELHSHFKENDDIPRIIRVPILVASNFLFQGTLYMDRTERFINISLTFGIGIIIQQLIQFDRYSWVKSLSMAHLLNFFLNGHPWAFAIHQIHPKLINTSQEDFDYWMNRLETVGNNSNSIAGIGVYGSHVREGLDTGSDLDVRVISYPGRREKVISSLLICRERVRAALTCFPIDIYVFDGPNSLGQLRDDEQPKILVDKEGWL